MGGGGGGNLASWTFLLFCCFLRLTLVSPSPTPTPVQDPCLSIILTFHLCFSASLSVVLARPPLDFLPQDDRMRTPLLKLKLAVCSVMPEQIAKYNMDCMAKVAK